VIALAFAVAAVTPPAGAVTSAVTRPRCAYGWPVKPFHEQHPIRGFFGDPRGFPGAKHTPQFHFGVDVSAPDGTAVYATLTGTATIHPRHADVVLITAGSTVFEYWHIVPAIRSGSRAVAYRTLIGHIERTWEHVHFSERIGGVYLNPLRPGALGPFFDPTRPTVRAIQVVPAGSGAVDVVADVADETPLPVAAPWDGKPVVPAVVRWRLRGSHGVATPWRTAADFRRTIPAASVFYSVYTRWTTQNFTSIDGRYGVYLAHGLDTRRLADGTYVIEVVAADAQGNSGRGARTVVVHGGRCEPAPAV
jgi:hypothetical protein